MRRKVERTDEARADLDRHFTYIARRNPRAARRFLKAAEAAFRLLLRTLHSGDYYETEEPELAGVRMWCIRGFENYVVFFRPVDMGIQVVRVLHAAQDFRAILEP